MPPHLLPPTPSATDRPSPLPRCARVRRYKKGSHAKGRNVFLKDIEPFIKWLDEAEEDEEEEA